MAVVLPGKMAAVLGTGILTHLHYSDKPRKSGNQKGAETVRTEYIVNIRGTSTPATATSDCKRTVAKIARYLKASCINYKTQCSRKSKSLVRFSQHLTWMLSAHIFPFILNLAPDLPFPLPFGYHRKNQAQIKPQQPVEERLQIQ